MTIVDRTRGDRTRLRADRVRLRQIITNLIGNAVKFTPAGGRVEVTSERDADGCLALTVSDTGVGIPAADLAVVQQPFGRSGSSPHPGEHSSGLGLSISRGLVELHGGRLCVESQPGHGTRVTVTLPPERLENDA